MTTVHVRHDNEVVRAAQAAIRREPLLAAPEYSITLDFDEGVLVVDGEVPSIAVKRRALQRVAMTPGLAWIADRLRVQPAERMGDGAVADHVCRALLEEPALSECAVRREVRGDTAILREPAGRRGDVTVAVEEGIVILDGEAPSLSHKRLAGALAWWVPGTRDVVDALAVSPPETDSDDEVTDAVRLVLEKDPFIEASQIHVTSRGRVVVLEGLVQTDAEREMAEGDAWYVFGVVDVVNRVHVRGEPTGRIRTHSPST